MARMGKIEGLLVALAAAMVTWVPHDASAQQPSGAAEMPAGLRLFLATGCGACHRIRGTEATGRIGPDLTHLASRETIGANMLPLDADSLTAWITETQRIKPGARMPSFGMLPDSETKAIVDYLMSLE